ncbi:MAG TPA: dTDP-4-dehydrorhamnose reductase [Streptosporangiaceae bacterium]
MTGWLILGAGGMLGRDLLAALHGQHASGPVGGEAVVGLTRQDLDVTDEAALRAAIGKLRPKTVVNCAAWTAVDDAEQHEDHALEVNGRGPEFIAAACAETGARLVHVSTDYVFGGDQRRPYQEDDQPDPRTAYGRSKRAGEEAVRRLLPGSGFVVRTAWLYGAHGHNFVRTMIRLASERQIVKVVADQHGQPTWTADVATKIIELARSSAPAGVYHATSSGETTWFGLAREVFRLLGTDPARVRPVASSEHPRPAARPGYSVLGHRAWAAAGIEPIGSWQRALSAAFPQVAAAQARSTSENARPPAPARARATASR